ncbi:MAG: YaaA family protein [Candidatus Limnocylindria bacterium]
MLIILPPSETKRPPPEAGTVLKLDRLSFPALGPTRTRVLDALVATSRRPDALRRLLAGPRRAGDVARNLRIRELPTRLAPHLYAGPLYEGLDPMSWSAVADQRAADRLIIVSALWGALRPRDRIPPYRLHVCARLVGLDRLEPMWRSVLPAILAEAADAAGPVLDLRSPSYQAVGRPTGLDDQTIIIRIRQSTAGGRRVGDVVAKRMRGAAARHLLESAREPEDPVEVAEILAARWPVELEPPSPPRRSWTISLEANP